MSRTESYEGYDFRCVISVGGIRGVVSDSATLRRVAGYILGQPDVRSDSYSDNYFNFQTITFRVAHSGQYLEGILKFK